jgi:hypothetical protein
VSVGMSGGIMESLICEPVEVQVSASLEPAIEVYIARSIHTRFSDSVLIH